MGLDLVIQSTACAAVVTDKDHRVVAVNDAGAKLLAVSSLEALGKTCHDTLCGKDRFGNRFCHEQCAVDAMVHRGEPIRPFELEVGPADRGTVRVGCSIMVIDGDREDEKLVLHLMTPLLNGAKIAQPFPAAAGSTDFASESRDLKMSPLTARETDVLRLLAQGRSCQDIADLLFISLPTVRNHIQSFLRKLEVHNQVGAVAIAYQKGLL